MPQLNRSQKCDQGHSSQCRKTILYPDVPESGQAEGDQAQVWKHWDERKMGKEPIIVNEAFIKWEISEKESCEVERKRKEEKPANHRPLIIVER